MILLIDSKLIAYHISQADERSLVEVVEFMPDLVEYLEATLLETTSRIIFAYDIGKSDYRLALHPGYKAGRNHTRMAKDFSSNYTNFLPPLAEALGIHNVGVNGVEADDLISILAATYKGDEQLVIVSADRDLLQLTIGTSIKMFDPRQQQFITSELKEKSHFIINKAVTSDIGDQIFGIHMCGKTCFDKWATPLFNDPKSTNLEFFRRHFISLGNSSHKFRVHDKYLNLGIIKHEKDFNALFDLNIALGATMEDTSKFTAIQLSEYKKCLQQKPKFTNADDVISKAITLSNGREGLFGDIKSINTTVLNFFKDRYSG